MIGYYTTGIVLIVIFALAYGWLMFLWAEEEGVDYEE